MEIEIVEDSYEGLEEIPCVDLNKIPDDEEVQSTKHEDPNAKTLAAVSPNNEDVDFDLNKFPVEDDEDDNYENMEVKEVIWRMLKIFLPRFF
ncbi:hypothetical protein SESBI_42546 [Sesbania bispinosa]|nr:hypothetical protein SESBI_42546 [Sesbania bispinosa]